MGKSTSSGEKPVYVQLPPRTKVVINKYNNALYLPALNSCFMNGIKDEYIKRRGRWQPHFIENQFDVFTANHPVKCNNSLLSAGHEPYKRVTVQYEQLQQRGPETMLMGDSGGFQIATDKLKIKWDDQENVDSVRIGILKFLEANCDIAATLDVPTFTIGQEGFKFNTYDQCLDQTLENMEFWMKHRTPGMLNLMNVIQGRNDAEVDTWLAAVKDYPTEGWCFSSANSDCLYHMFRTMLLLIKNGKINEQQSWVHVLGRTMPAVSVLLSDLQQRVRARTGVELQISFDSSSFVQAARTGSILDHNMDNKLKISISKARLTHDVCDDNPITLSEYLDSPSEIGKAIRLNHIFVTNEKKTKEANEAAAALAAQLDDLDSTGVDDADTDAITVMGWDVPTYAQIMAYNYEMTRYLMDKAHDMYENDDICRQLMQVKHVILPAVFAHDDIDDSLAELARHKHFLCNEILKYKEPVQTTIDNAELFSW